MGKGVDWEEVQSGNWNVAKPWTVDKIHRWSVLVDDFQTLATFGTSDIYGDVFTRDINLKNTARIHAFKRLVHAIKTLIRNTKFAVGGSEERDFIPEECKKESQKSKSVDFNKLLGYYLKRSNKIEKSINYLRVEKKRGSKVVELSVNERLFEKMMSEITDMIDDINYILNYNNLIFTHTEEYDPKKIKESLKERFVNRG